MFARNKYFVVNSVAYRIYGGRCTAKRPSRTILDKRFRLCLHHSDERHSLCLHNHEKAVAGGAAPFNCRRLTLLPYILPLSTARSFLNLGKEDAKLMLALVNMDKNTQDTPQTTVFLDPDQKSPRAAEFEEKLSARIVGQERAVAA
jgi:hypothetical protein